jgi:hypothetical protein
MIRITFELEEFEVVRLSELGFGVCYTIDTDNPVAFMKIEGSTPNVCVGVNLHTGAKHVHEPRAKVFPLVADLTLRRSRGGKA